MLPVQFYEDRSILASRMIFLCLFWNFYHLMALFFDYIASEVAV